MDGGGLVPGQSAHPRLLAPKPDARPPPEPEARWRKRMWETMRTEAAMERYKRRKCIVKPMFGILRA